MELGHRTKSQEPLSDILNDAQMTLLSNWLTMENLELDGYEDGLLYGVRIFALDSKTDERWEIDFIRRKNNEKI